MHEFDWNPLNQFPSWKRSTPIVLLINVETSPRNDVGHVDFQEIFTDYQHFWTIIPANHDNYIFIQCIIMVTNQITLFFL